MSGISRLFNPRSAHLVTGIMVMVMMRYSVGL